MRRAVVVGLAGLAVLGAAMLVGGGRPSTLVVLPGGNKVAATVLRHAGLYPAVDTHGASDALLLGSGGVPREVVGMAPGPSGASALYAAPVRSALGGTPSAEAGPRRVIGGATLGVADVADAGGYLAIALGSNGQVSAVRIQRGLGPTVAVFALRPPSESVTLRADTARRSAVRVRWTGRTRTVRRAVLYQGNHGWHSTSSQLRLQPAPVPRRNLFIHVVEWVRTTFGGRPVALAEDAWYRLIDFVRRHLYALRHSIPVVHPTAATRTAAGSQLRAQPSASSTASAAAHPAITLVGSTTTMASPHLPRDLRIPAGFPQAKGEGVWVPVGPSAVRR